MVNILSAGISGSAPTQGAVGTTSATIVSFNANRMGLAIVNTSTGTVYLAFGANPAVVGSGIALVASGGTFVMDDFMFSKEIVSAIGHSANAQVSIQEWTT